MGPWRGGRTARGGSGTGGLGFQLLQIMLEVLGFSTDLLADLVGEFPRAPDVAVILIISLVEENSLTTPTRCISSWDASGMLSVTARGFLEEKLLPCCPHHR